MLCESCKKKEANVHYTGIFNNETHEMHLCSSCAKKNGIASILPSMTGLISNEKSCKYCGLSYDDFKENGRLGCSRCYESFSKELAALVRRMHGRTQHIGKVPERRKTEVFKEKELLTLKRELKKLIGEEKYEEAAVTRDRINLLEGVEK